MGEAKRIYQARDGVVRTTIVDPDRPDDLIVKTTSDIEAILAGIARDRETMRHGHNKHAARLPLFIWENLVHRGIAFDDDALTQWLNSYEAAPWRIWRGDL